jgi:isopentenyldiphosphate isomerase
MFDEKYYIDILTTFSAKLPKTPDGRIDYTYADKAAVLTIFIKHQQKILLLKRSDKVLTYKEKWNTVAGYLDEIAPIKNKIYEELEEELNIKTDNIALIRIGSHFEFFDSVISKTWIVFSVLVSLHQKPDIHLDWEHTNYQWIDPEDLDEYKTVPKLMISFQHSLHGGLLST